MSLPTSPLGLTVMHASHGGRSCGLLKRGSVKQLPLGRSPDVVLWKSWCDALWEPRLLGIVTSLPSFACPGLVLTGWSVACRTGAAEARLQDRQTQQFLPHSRSLEHGAWHSGLETNAPAATSQQEKRELYSAATAAAHVAAKGGSI